MLVGLADVCGLAVGVLVAHAKLGGDVVKLVLPSDAQDLGVTFRVARRPPAEQEPGR